MARPKKWESLRLSTRQLYLQGTHTNGHTVSVGSMWYTADRSSFKIKLCRLIYQSCPHFQLLEAKLYCFENYQTFQN